MEDWEPAFRQEIAQQGHSGFIVDVMVDNERRRREKERDADRYKLQPGARLVESDLPLGVTISGGVSAIPSIPDMPPAYHKYAVRLTAAIEYLAKNNYGTAEIHIDREINVTPQHLRNTLRAVRNFMLSNPPLGYPIQNLTFVDTPNGVVVRDKRKSEPFKVTVPVAKLDVIEVLPYPVVLTPELISALAVVLSAVDQTGELIKWPDFAVEIVEPENVMAYNDLMRQSFPKHWNVGLAGLTTVEITKVKA